MAEEEGECASSEDSEVESVLLDEESDEEDTDKVALNKLQQLGFAKIFWCVPDIRCLFECRLLGKTEKHASQSSLTTAVTRDKSIT